jgi:hypothetical protein
MQNWGERIFSNRQLGESLHQDSNNNGVRAVKFNTFKNLVVKSTMFSHRTTHKYTKTSPDGKTHSDCSRIDR